MSSIKKERIDKLLVDSRFVESRAKAQALLLAGKVFANGEKVEKSGAMVNVEASIEVRNNDAHWVSRGAHKLLKGLDVFNVSPSGAVCVDIGASTGGFTHVLLERGAHKVYAIDVGYGQLAWSLRQNRRVVVMERTNARNIIPDNFQEDIDITVADASFISLKLILPVIQEILAPQGNAIVLVKPQFEVGKGRVGKRGVVRAKEDHICVLEKILSFCRQTEKLLPAGLTYSPVTGPMGNMEYLLHLIKAPGASKVIDSVAVVEEAHLFFRKEG